MTQDNERVLAKMPIRFIPDPDNPGIMLQVQQVVRPTAFQLTQRQAGNAGNTIMANGEQIVVTSDGNLGVEFEDGSVRFLVFINGEVELVSRITENSTPVRFASPQPIPEEGKQ